MKIVASTLAAVMLVAASAAQASVAVVNFDDQPLGPSFFSDPLSSQTLVYAPATFSGGVVLGNPSSFPANSFASAPNVYGTASFPANRYQPALTITIDPTFATTEVSFALFNGLITTVDYTVTAFNGVTPVDVEHFTIASNLASGFALPDLISAGGITSVVIAPDGNPSEWDFLIDTVAFNESVQQTAAVAEPATWTFMVAGIAGLAAAGRRRTKAALRGRD